VTYKKRLYLYSSSLVDLLVSPFLDGLFPPKGLICIVLCETVFAATKITVVDETHIRTVFKLMF